MEKAPGQGTALSTFNATSQALSAASNRPFFVLGSAAICQGLSIGPIATEVLAALQSKAGTYGYKIAVVPEEGSLPYPQLVSLISEANLTSVSVAPPPGSSDSAVLASLKQSTGVPYSEMLIFACTLELIRAGNRCGALTVPASTTGLTAQLLSDGLQRFEQHQLDQHGFGQNKFSYWRTLFKGAETCNP